MKKVLLCAAFAVAGMSLSNAQETSFGVKGGLNLANFGGDAEGAESLTSFHIGGFAQFAISEKFMIQPELLYSGQGAQAEEDNDFKSRINYINLPVMAKFMVAEGFSVEAGPQIGFVISAEDTDGDIEVDAKDDYETIDFGLGFGLGYELPSGLLFSARYNVGLSNILSSDFGDDISVTNNVFQLSIGYKFN